MIYNSIFLKIYTVKIVSTRSTKLVPLLISFEQILFFHWQPYSWKHWWNFTTLNVENFTTLNVEKISPLLTCGETVMQFHHFECGEISPIWTWRNFNAFHHFKCGEISPVWMWRNFTAFHHYKCGEISPLLNCDEILPLWM